MNIDSLKEKNRIIYEFVSGSHSYGLNVPTSDVDIRGIFFHTKKELISLEIKGADPISDTKNDTSYYSIGRYFELARDCNPNIIEFLFIPKQFVKINSPIAQEIIKNRDLFISKKAKHTFSGYSFAQIKKAKGENKWINNPQPKEHPKREDFCFFVQTGLFSTYLINLDTMPCRPVKISNTKIDLSTCKVSSVEHIDNLYRLYKNGGGVFRNGNLVCESVGKEDESQDFIGLMIYNHHGYEAASRDYKNYWEWIENRNVNRWISQENKEIDYDSKNIMHCLRLLISGINILKNGEPIIYFEGEQREFLMDVRLGKFSYDYVIKLAEDKMSELDELYKTSNIPNTVNHDKINELYLNIIDKL